ncbi:MAG: PAS domain-containing protein, partial [Solirubrobacterales bacterium]|nr:PAS domain-containing protein [Solirubrobacterales bacterium]
MPGSGSSVEKRKAGRGVSPLLDGLLEGGASVERVYDQIHSLVDNLPAWVALRDLAGDYQLINAYAFEKAGHLAAAATREQTLGRSVSDLFGPDVVAKFKAADEEVLASGQSVAYDMELPGPSGEPRTYEFTTYPVRARDGEILGLGRHGLDVTEIRRERREKEAAQQLLTTSFNYAPAGVAL